MLTANKLEKIMELEDNLRSEYQAQLDAKTAEIESAKQANADLQATIARQLDTITDLSSKSSANERVEQLNRELTNRAEKLQDEIAELKKRVKTLQKELSEDRSELKKLKQFDPERVKKSLDATKKKMAEKQNANDQLQKALNKTKAERLELQRTVSELEGKLEALEPEAEAESDSAADSEDAAKTEQAAAAA